MLTKKQAIKECKELWVEIKRSKLSKDDFLETEDGKKWVDKDYYQDCPLCQYVYQKDNFKDYCASCPLCIQYKGAGCYDLGYDSLETTTKWLNVIKGLKE